MGTILLTAIYGLGSWLFDGRPSDASALVERGLRCIAFAGHFIVISWWLHRDHHPPEGEDR